MNDKEMSDNELMDQIRAAVEHLNELLGKAADANIRFDVDTQDVTTMRDRTRHVRVEVWNFHRVQFL